MIRIDIFNTACHLETQTVAPTLPGFQGLKMCIKYLSTHPHKIIFTLLIHMKDKIESDLHMVEIRLKITQPKVFLITSKMRTMPEF